MEDFYAIFICLNWKISNFSTLLHTWTFIYADLKSEKHFLKGGGEGRKTAIFSLFWNSEVEWQLNE